MASLSGISAQAGSPVPRGEIQWLTTWVHKAKGGWRFSSTTWPISQSMKLKILDTDVCVSFLAGEHIDVLGEGHVLILCVKDMKAVFGNLPDLTLCVSFIIKL